MCERRTEDQGPLRMFAKVKDLIFQLLELLIVQPHPFTGRTLVDLYLVPNCWYQVRMAFWTFQLCLRFNQFLSSINRHGFGKFYDLKTLASLNVPLVSCKNHQLAGFQTVPECHRIYIAPIR